MPVTFTKVDGKRYFVAIERGYGPPLLVPRSAPGYDDLMPHDLAYYLVEEHAGIELGVFGQVAYGDGMLSEANELVDSYLRALSTADADLAVSLFVDGGLVHSPLYGTVVASDFYPALFADTSQANVTLKCVMNGIDTGSLATVSFWFHFDWRLPAGAAAPFDVVDVARLHTDGKIKDLHIIYDTVDVRPAFEAEVQRPSWRRTS
jgi:hypothetical protein